MLLNVGPVGHRHQAVISNSLGKPAGAACDLEVIPYPRLSPPMQNVQKIRWGDWADGRRCNRTDLLCTWHAFLHRGHGTAHSAQTTGTNMLIPTPSDMSIHLNLVPILPVQPASCLHYSPLPYFVSIDFECAQTTSVNQIFDLLKFICSTDTIFWLFLYFNYT